MGNNAEQRLIVKGSVGGSTGAGNRWQDEKAGGGVADWKNGGLGRGKRTNQINGVKQGG